MTNTILDQVVHALDELKGLNIKSIDVSKHNPLTDHMVVVSGTSSRHVKSMADNLMRELKCKKIKPCHQEGDLDNEWVLIDAGDVVVHIMHPRTRDFYNIEGLWATCNQREHAVA